MPLTKQIIQGVVHKEVKSELIPITKKLDGLSDWFDTLSNQVGNLTNKVDKLTDIVTDFAGSVKKFDEEQTVMSGQVSNLADRVDKIELSVA